MPFAVHISIVGLCLSQTRQDPKKKNWKLQIAMPNDMHTAAITYDGRYKQPNSAFEWQRLDGSTLDFSPIAPSDAGFRPRLPAELLNVEPILGSTSLKPFKCGTAQSDNVKCLITIRHGSCAGIGLPKTWEVFGEGRRLTHCVEWRIEDVQGESLDLFKMGVPLDGNGDRLILYPIDSPDGPEIRFSLVCLPENLICHEPTPEPAPDPGKPSPHFPMFKCLFDPWNPMIVPIATDANDAPGMRLGTLSAQDCIGAGWGGG